jgi:hypothetical protein
MQKLLASLTVGVITLTSVATAFAGEFDLTQKVEKTAGYLKVGNITMVLPNDAVPATSNFISKEVSGMSPELDASKYALESKYVKLSLQDTSGKEIKFSTGVSMSVEVSRDTLKSPAILFSNGSGTTEIPSVFTPETKTIMAEGVTDVNGVFAIVDKLSVTTSSSTATWASATQPGLENAVSSMSGSNQTPIMNATMSGATGTGVGIDMASASNLQSREKGANVYVLIIAMLSVMSLGGFFLYRKV